MATTKKPTKKPQPRGVRKKPLAEDGYHPVEMLVGIGIGLGLKRESIADLAGVSVGTVDNRRKSDFAGWVAQKTKEASSRFVVSTREDLNREFERRWGKALDVLDESMAAYKADGTPDWSAKLKASEVVLDRTLGKATQRTEMVSEHTENVVHHLPEAVLTFLEQRQAPQLEEAQIINVVAEES
jgi:hypothetical protein